MNNSKLKHIGMINPFSHRLTLTAKYLHQLTSDNTGIFSPCYSDDFTAFESDGQSKEWPIEKQKFCNVKISHFTALLTVEN